MPNIQVEMKMRTSAATLWRLWTDVAGSPEWDTDVSWSRLEGKFEVGSRGEFKLKSGPRLSFVITEVRPQQGYANLVRLPGLSVRFTHSLEPLSSTELRVIHGAEMSGPFGRLLGLVARNAVAKALRSALANLSMLAERQCAA